MTALPERADEESPRLRRARARRRAVRLCDRAALVVVAVWGLVTVSGAFPPQLDAAPGCSRALVALGALLAAVLVVRRRIDPITPLREVPLLVRAGGLAGRAWLTSARFVPGAFIVVLVLAACGAVARYRGFASPAWGLAHFENILWNSLQGRVGLSSFLGDRSLAVPVAPMLAVLVLPYAAIPRSETLLAVQAVALAWCVFPLARLARRELGSASLAHALVLAQAAYLPIRAVARYDFEPALLAAPLLLECLASIREGRMRRATGAWAAALACHPAVIPAAAAIGLWVSNIRGRRSLGLMLTAAALLWGGAALLLARSAGATDPWRVLVGAHAAVHDGFAPGWGAGTIALVALAPLCFLPVFAPAHALLALPSLALAMAAAARSGAVGPHLATAAPLLLAASTLGARTLIDRDDLRTVVAFYPTVAELESYLAGLLLVAAGAFVGWSPIAELRLARADGRVAREELVTALPPDRSVSTQASVAVHLARRRDVAMFPDRLAPWIVLDGGRWPGPTMNASDGARWSERLRGTHGCVTEAEAGAVARFHCDPGALRALASWAAEAR